MPHVHVFSLVGTLYHMFEKHRHIYDQKFQQDQMHYNHVDVRHAQFVAVYKHVNPKGQIIPLN